MELNPKLINQVKMALEDVGAIVQIIAQIDQDDNVGYVIDARWPATGEHCQVGEIQEVKVECPNES